MVLRPLYLEIFKTYRDVPLVKILAAIRRSAIWTLTQLSVNMKAGGDEAY